MACHPDKPRPCASPLRRGLHPAQHQLVLYATTVDGDLDLDITADHPLRFAVIGGRSRGHARCGRHICSYISHRAGYPSPVIIAASSSTHATHQQNIMQDAAKLISIIPSRPPPTRPPGVRLITKLVAHPSWTALHTALAAGVAVGISPAADTHLPPGLPRDPTTLHMTFGQSPRTHRGQGLRHQSGIFSAIAGLQCMHHKRTSPRPRPPHIREEILYQVYGKKPTSTAPSTTAADTLWMPCTSARRLSPKCRSHLHTQVRG